jgi:cell wall-associated NlpC family hydrolase
MYIGGNQFIHAPHTGDVVKISSISGSYEQTYMGARRL